MPAHTNKRTHQCIECSVRYKSASSLSLHKTKCHSSNSRKLQRRSSTPVAVNKSKSIKTTPKIKHDNECETFNELKMESDGDLGDLGDMVMEWVPVDHVPFHWDESDLKLILPIDPQTLENAEELQNFETDTTVNGSSDQKNAGIDGSILKISDLENRPAVESPEFKQPVKRKPMAKKPVLKRLAVARPKIKSPVNKPPAVKRQTVKQKPPKPMIWQKETVDSSDWVYVDILREPKSKAAHRSAASDAPKQDGTVTMKDTGLANRFRNFGDTEFAQKNWRSARQWYNRSLCYAEPKTHYFSTAYAKRSQCYFNEGSYQTCWTDLFLAQDSFFPETLLPQLERHKRSCKAMLKKQSRQTDVALANIEPMLSFAPNSMCPEMAEVLQIDCNEYYGRHIRANQSIAVGQILIIEKGFVIASTAYYQKCCICLAADTNFLPCSRCAQALFCQSCANSWLHQFECELQTALNLHAYPWITKVLRSFLIALNLFQTIDELMEFVDDAISSEHGKSTTTPTINDKKSKYRAFLQLITVPATQPELKTMIAKLHNVVLKHPIIGRKFQTTKSRRFLAHLLAHHICVINAFTTKIGSVDSEHGSLEIVAPITSYLRHSCTPNVSKFLLGDSVVVVAMRPIEPGEQLFVSYCDILMAKKDRQSILQTEYGFQCKCERCSSAVDFELNWQSIVDRQFYTFQSDTIDNFVKENFDSIAGDDQLKRKQLNEHLTDILQRFGRMPWSYTVTWAYVVFSLLLSQRFQKKLQY